MEEEKLGIEFKSPLKPWNDSIFISSFSILFLIIIALFNFKPHPVFAIIISTLGFVLFFIVRKITLSVTILKVHDGLLIIKQKDNLLKIDKELSISTENLRGYEINQVTRGNNALFIYDQSFNYYKYALSNIKDEEIIHAYLANYLKKIDKNSNPLFSSFFRAFLFAIKNTFVFIALSLITIASLCFADRHYHFELTSTVLFFFSGIIGIAFWWLIIRRQTKRSYFRFGAYYWLLNCFFYVSPLLTIPLLNNWHSINEEIIQISHPFDVLRYRDQQAFRINNISFNPNSIRLSNFRIGTIGKHSFPIKHYYITPIGGGEQIKRNAIYNFWLGKTYVQQIKNSNGPITRNNLITNFHSISEENFINSLKELPVFYKKMKFDEGMETLFQYNSNAARKNIVLEPHWEDILTYRRNIQDQINLIMASILALNLIGCIFIAINR